MVQLGDTIIAEHHQASRAGQCIVQRDHLAELWKITERQTPMPRESRWRIDFETSVQTLPLSRFEEVLA